MIAVLPGLSQSCLCCGGNDLITLEKGVFSCRHCHHLWRESNSESLREHYAKLSGRNTMPERYIETKLCERIDFLRSYIFESCSVLEVGCAEGEMGARLKSNHNLNYFGLELSIDADQARQKLDAVYFDISEIDQAMSFDLILAFHVLEHIADINGAIEKWTARLKRNGRIIIEVPNRSGHPLVTVDKNPEHIHQFDIVSLASLLGNHGLEIESLATGLFESPCYCDSIRAVAKKKQSAEQKQAQMGRLIQQQMGQDFDVFGIGGDFYNYVYPVSEWLTIVHFFDNAAHGTQIKNHNVVPFSPDLNQARPILICTVRYEDEIYQQLLSLGIPSQRITLLSDVLKWIVE